MAIDDNTIDKIAELSRLSFNKEEKEDLKKDLSKILTFVDTLNEVNTDGVEPLIYMNDHEDELRTDEVSYTVPQTEALKNAPKKDSDYFKVPKVLKKGE